MSSFSTSLKFIRCCVFKRFICRDPNALVALAKACFYSPKFDCNPSLFEALY